MSRMTNALSFFAGAAIGGGLVWYYIREKETARADREIESVKETYAKREQADRPDKPATSILPGKNQDKPDLADYVKRLEREGYTEYSRTIEPAEKENPETSEDGPYVISPAEFGEIEEYNKISLTYFADGILADELNEPVDDVEEIVGDALEHFGEYEDDSVFVRNDAKRCDYEILQDLRNFKDVLEDMPPRPN